MKKIKNKPMKNIDNKLEISGTEIDEDAAEQKAHDDLIDKLILEDEDTAPLERLIEPVRIKTQNVPLKPKFGEFIEYSMNEARVYMHGFTGVGSVRIFAQTESGIKEKVESVPKSGYLLFENNFDGEPAIEIITVRSGGVNGLVKKTLKVAPTVEVLSYLDKTVTLEVAKGNCSPCHSKK